MKIFKIFLLNSIILGLFAGPFLSRPIKPKIEDPDYYLFTAVKRGNLNEVKDALEAGANVNSIDDEGKTPLMKFIDNPIIKIGNIWEIIQILLQSGTDINKLDNSGKNIKNHIDDWHNAQYGKFSIHDLDVLYELLIEYFNRFAIIQGKINREIKLGLSTKSAALNSINTLPLFSKNYRIKIDLQMIINYLLYKIKNEYTLTAIANTRRMLITAAHRIAKSVIKSLNSLEKILNTKDNELTKAIIKQIPVFDDLPDDIKLVILYQILLKQNFPFTNFNRTIPMKDGRIIRFADLIAEEIRTIDN
ncbi:hypothetical protein A3F66_05050 [candidate division TM6 bacterium RIFCSPHIGHO2_12_FULL_32_22]|nr:MAG: hypothetical protein A3F66_05050 [candidate division TM6 bacterium RIFCSPHIGHO2_12_FULL_32_22]